MTDDSKKLLRRLPKVDRLLESAAVESLLEEHARPVLVDELRVLLEDLREEIRAGGAGADDIGPEAVAVRLGRRLERRARPFYHRVINATGVVLHTGLGRAALAPEAADAVGRLARGPQRLELELDTGERGGRDRGCAQLLTRLTGAEAATVVNNNAAATLLILAAFARGRRAVVSRGELVEIGGSYRIPDVMEESGALLTEVGTTNRTHLRDYRRAIERDRQEAEPERETEPDREAGHEPGSDKTEDPGGSAGIGLLLKVHTSNYRVVGFTSGVALEELVELGREHGIPVVHDLGSGCLVDLGVGTGGAGDSPTLTAWGETLVSRSVAAGADLVCFSGDKLLGGPQAGILVGRAEAIERCRRHPLFRALRPGRMIYTALEATLRIYEAGEEEARQRLPVLARLRDDPVALRRRARRWATRWEELPGLEATAVACHSQAGSGALPARDLSSWGIQMKPANGTADDLARALRTGDPSILARVRDDAVLFDLRTLAEGEMEEIGERLEEIIRN